MLIPDHPSHLQIFDGNRVKLSHDIERCLVVKVRALASYLLMLLRQQVGCFSSSLRSLLAPGDFWTGKTDTTRTDLRQMNLVAFEPKAALRIGEGIVPGRG